MKKPIISALFLLLSICQAQVPMAQAPAAKRHGAVALNLSGFGGRPQLEAYLNRERNRFLSFQLGASFANMDVDEADFSGTNLNGQFRGIALKPGIAARTSTPVKRLRVVGEARILGAFNWLAGEADILADYWGNVQIPVKSRSTTFGLQWRLGPEWRLSERFFLQTSFCRSILGNPVFKKGLRLDIPAVAGARRPGGQVDVDLVYRF